MPMFKGEWYGRWCIEAGRLGSRPLDDLATLGCFH
jgi:hypothetical protein